VKLNLVSVIPAERDRVFAALIDPQILRVVIPGCESLTETGPDEYAATLKIGAAGMKGTYNGKAAVRDKTAARLAHPQLRRQGRAGICPRSSGDRPVEEAQGTRIACDVDVVSVGW
jgi:carbon monoxide dehydrogenase subunit G